ncbi:hypothetical protein A2U01_0083066, partial [Trifolium medium]|nr:hypothetical protein [Trifolium medium]
VRYSNVRDVAKLLRALNAVSFGNYRVRAVLARFDRNDTLADKSFGTKREGLSKGGKDLVTKAGNHWYERMAGHKSADAQIVKNDVAI